MPARMPTEVQAPIVALPEPQPRQRLRKSSPQLIRTWVQRRIFAQTTRAVCVTPSDEKSRDFRRFNKHRLTAPGLGSLEIDGDAPARGVDVQRVLW